MAYFENKQWRVLEDGSLESVNVMAPEYRIPAREMGALTHEINEDVFYEWPWHMSEKTWIDMLAFEEAFTKALQVNEVEVNQKILSDTFRFAHEEVSRRRPAQQG